MHMRFNCATLFLISSIFQLSIVYSSGILSQKAVYQWTKLKQVNTADYADLMFWDEIFWVYKGTQGSRAFKQSSHLQ